MIFCFKKFLYRADGTKLRKIYNDANANNETFASVTEYLDGFHYLKSQGTPFYDALDPMEFSYEQEAFIYDMLQIEPNAALQFFPTAEGFYDFKNNEYIYQYKDHLGNVRVSYRKDGNSTEITDQNDYYPFGMNIPRDEESIVGTASLYNYKYNGKELQETGMYDYGARFYMSDIGRWGVVDPLAIIYHYATPYNYTLNNPIYYKDPDGKRVIATDEETQNTILGYITEQFGENNGFYFNKKGELGYKNSLLKKLSKKFNNEQLSMINGLKELVNDENKTIEVKINEKSDSFTVDYNMPGFVMGKDEKGNEYYVQENGVNKREGWEKMYDVELDVSNSGGAFFWSPGKFDSTDMGYGYVVMNKSTIGSLQLESEKGKFTVPSASSVFFHEMLDHGLDFLKNNNVNKSIGSGIENVYYHNQALKNISNGQSPIRNSHYDKK
ncbi:RHS repeat domain-containing protein [Frigoriflavimonas asaccharolytica]|uniref:RHS repeat-associated protein n=1 Tax=Frigoriflavimonas asaccharolytica TaxID=2735899 RepID=A0A8J8G9A5_9FLAO|nr:RHS repeat-associated core domain-containing protein [Frigoriflavimonas asaccharolytica]NRS93686.1 RHS repeat-associated protein [Frigoriflavimonas asaccharolytica]